MIQCWMVSEENPIYVNAKTATTNYQEQVDKVGKAHRREKVGEPWVHCWVAVIDTIADTVEAFPEGPERQKAQHEIKTYQNHFQTQGAIFGALREVRHCRMAKCHKKNYKRFEITLRPNSPAESFYENLVIPYLRE